MREKTPLENVLLLKRMKRFLIFSPVDTSLNSKAPDLGAILLDASENLQMIKAFEQKFSTEIFSKMPIMIEKSPDGSVGFYDKQSIIDSFKEPQTEPTSLVEKMASIPPGDCSNREATKFMRDKIDPDAVQIPKSEQPQEPQIQTPKMLHGVPVGSQSKSGKISAADAIAKIKKLRGEG